ncbi:hypothetical protein CHGG_06170 [Chaetomium globosum CBS 148.51]|uniref:FHA domain-containing protein n=1 Tax=Chaetomium globosum (strain ATCC 6205 / CBS 148.51 / DSM 1962 / NBRC 6347 / NRRL 1970) TaxID=306901 RepID=Q2H595_CHAGB|nr:uncharacterized protein CHGG_06170 [Chaetomium globosum CBS 148.51]EAQ89551.1 hypothetical protein CHGG_06170 [Chaetomium globosum CBS 148.51]
MTAVANPPSFANLNRPGWINGAQTLNSMNPSSDDVRGVNMLMQRKPLQRSSSSSSVSSTSSNSSTSTVTSNPASQPNGVPMPGAGSTDGWSNPASRKRPTPKGPWSNGKPDGAGDLHRATSGRAPLTNGINGTSGLGQQQSVMSTPIQLGGQTGLGRPGTEGMGSGRQPVLYLLSLNGSFERKTISVPYFPDTLRIGRQTNAKTVPTPINGFFDSKVLSRQHAEIWADTNGKIWIRDVKSSNGTFVNGTRLSPENRDSDPHELQTQDHLELGIDIVSEDQKTVTEMRNARLQNQDLARTSQFISALLSKEDVRNSDKTEAPEPPKGHLPNGNISFRSDGGKTRFSEPPAPPPSQPLPEKPDTARASDAPSLKRGITERPKLASTSPIRQDNNLNQILLLTEALNNAKKELDSNTARVRDLEEMLTKEREARLHAEDMMQKMEETSHANMNGSAEAPPSVNGHSELDSAFEPPSEQIKAAEAGKAPDSPDDDDGSTTLQQPDKAELLTAAFQARIESMAMEMTSLKEQLEAFKLRAEKAEAERDADRKTLAEMVLQIRQRDEDEKRRETQRKTRSVSKGRRHAPSEDTAAETPDFVTNGSTKVTPAAQTGGVLEEETSNTAPTPSRGNTMKPNVGTLKVQGQQSQDGPLLQALPYVSILTVVVFGMGLMASPQRLAAAVETGPLV